MQGDTKQRVVVAICTYKRNEPLKLLLEKLLVCRDEITHRAALGVVIVDDTPEGLARPVAQEFADRFELGLLYGISGRQNISLARNQAITRALEFADWVAMTDDDCEPHPDWLKEFLEVQDRTGADAVTGALRRRAPDGSPIWLTTQPFMEVGISKGEDGSTASTAATNCSMIRAQWLRDHPEVRFDPKLGVLGGEDMVFYRTARERGLRIHYSANGFVYENQPSARLTYRYQLQRFFWEGNSSYVTCVRQGVPSWRMFGQGGLDLVRSLARPVHQLVRGKQPQWRYCLAEVARSLGKMGGIVGLRVRHH
jgi:glycosyltransferase involved in cell wall biosynthesis